jgi:hypothetical protein
MLLEYQVDATVHLASHFKAKGDAISEIKGSQLVGWISTLGQNVMAPSINGDFIEISSNIG